MGLEPGPSKEGSWMMAQNDLVVAGIDVAKDKVDVCIRSLSLRRTFASTAEDRRELASWLRRNKVGPAVMEASGGYEREWAKALRVAKIEVRIVDPKRVRSFRSIGWAAGQERHDRCRDDCMVRRDLRPSSGPGLRCDARAASPDGPCAPGIEGHAIQADKPGRACATGCGAADSRPDIEDDRRRTGQDRGRDHGLD